MRAEKRREALLREVQQIADMKDAAADGIHRRHYLKASVSLHRQTRLQSIERYAFKLAMSESLDRAKKACGGAVALAKALSTRGRTITSQAVGQWEKVPSGRVLDVEAITGVSRYELRPDIYGRDPESDGPIAPAAVPASLAPTKPKRAIAAPAPAGPAKPVGRPKATEAA